MNYSEFSEVMELSKDYNLVPVSYAFLADQATPIQIYQTLRGKSTFLLESVEGGNRWGRYSFIGLNPFLRFRSKNQEIEILSRDGHTERTTGNPVQDLKNRLASITFLVYLLYLPLLQGQLVS